ncbi:hypothetical protein NQ314_010130 [Rhamnusium bicolor]|uniref:Integrase catalytic domain-containing protein n=1 Tax=Rhamnusium bicolor TaxID=1586634 RepID=A0AAV8XTA6_9CUCU|nr:hypothetical protein NQ314_010130 [Rhamnusium bicolor]
MKYQEIKFLHSTTSAVIIKHLTDLFARFGIPKSIRSDNGRQFVSQEFKKFCTENNIEVIHTPPYWPQANGQVKNMNRSILKRLKICHASGLDYKSELQKFILMYNVTPQGTTGKSPSELLFNRNIRDKIPSIIDLMAETGDEEARDNDIINKQKGKEKEDRTRNAKEADIKPGDKVLVENMIIPHKLTPRYDKNEYEVLQMQGNEVTLLRDGKILKRHVSHLKKVSGETESTSTSFPLPHNNLPILPANTAGQLEEEEEEEEEEGRPGTSSINPREEESSRGGGKGHQPTATISGEVQPLKLKKKDGVWQPMNT